MGETVLYLVPLFLVTSIAYSMVGLGGGSVYLPLLALFNVQYQSIPSIALSCNIVATLVTVYHFRKAGHLQLGLVLPFILSAIPFAFIGGMITIPEDSFRIALIVLLFLVAVRTLFWKNHEKSIVTPSVFKKYFLSISIGIFLGLIAGVIGIGGGIFLFPIILFLRWGHAKECAAASGLFTLCGSVAGLAGHGIKGEMDLHLLLPLLVAVIIGSQIGARLGSKKVSPQTVQNIFAVIILGIAIKLLTTLF